MKNYETIFICKPDSGEEKTKTLIEKVSATIKHYNGEIVSINEWGIRKLAYSISGHKEGFYVYIEFKAASSNIILEIDKVYRFTEDILRFLTIKVEKLKPIIRRKRDVTEQQGNENNLNNKHDTETSLRQFSRANENNLKNNNDTEEKVLAESPVNTDENIQVPRIESAVNSE